MYQANDRQRFLEPAVVSQHEVLRVQECERVRDQVLALNQHWKSRSPLGGFYTLGAAAYLDAVDRRAAYASEAREINPILLANFGWLCERVRKGFEQILEQRVSFGEECGLPGFHIFHYEGTDRSNDKPHERAHFDMQWMHALPGPRPEETLSFTLPIEEPTGGSSLEVWPAHMDTVQPGFEALPYAARYPSKTLRYARGQMVVHDGLLLHAIGLSSVSNPAGYRITFQGHGAHVSEGWKLYW